MAKWLAKHSYGTLSWEGEAENAGGAKSAAVVFDGFAMTCRSAAFNLAVLLGLVFTSLVISFSDDGEDMVSNKI